jgi:hypothetical protein
MQLHVPTRPTYNIAVCHQYDTDLEWQTIHFHSAVAEVEETEKARPVSTVIRLVDFVGSRQTAFLSLIQMHSDLKLPVDGHLTVRFLGPSAASSHDWRGIVILMTPFGLGYEHHTFIRRPKEHGTLVQEPRFDENAVIIARDYASAQDLQAAVLANRECDLLTAQNQHAA